MQTDFVVPGTMGPTVTASRSLLGNIELSIDGQKLKKDGWFSQRYWVTGSDTKSHELKLGGGLFTTTVEVEGQKLVLEPPMPMWARVLMMMPWLLIIIGGLIGGIFAGLGMELNRRIARADIRVPVKVVSMLLCTALAGTLWFGSVFALSWLFAPVPEYADGACYEGWWATAENELSAADLREVDCSEAHDAEVAGGFGLSDGAFPGVEAITGWAEQMCPATFEAYVGVPYERSRLLLQWTYPSEGLWGRGARDIDCFVTGSPGQSWIGSVQGSGR